MALPVGAIWPLVGLGDGATSFKSDSEVCGASARLPFSSSEGLVREEFYLRDTSKLICLLSVDFSFFNFFDNAFSSSYLAFSSALSFLSSSRSALAFAASSSFAFFFKILAALCAASSSALTYNSLSFYSFFFSFSAAFSSASSNRCYSLRSRSRCFSRSLIFRSSSFWASFSWRSTSFCCAILSFSSYFSLSFYSRSAALWAYSSRLSSSLIFNSSFLAASAYSACSTRGRIRSVERALSSSIPSAVLRSVSSVRIASVAYQDGRKSPSRFSLMIISLKTLSMDFLLHSGYLSLKSSMIYYFDSRD